MSGIEYVATVYEPKYTRKDKTAMSDKGYKELMEMLKEAIYEAREDSYFIVQFSKKVVIGDANATKLKNWVRSNTDLTNLNVREKEISFTTADDIIMTVILSSVESSFFVLGDDDDATNPDSNEEKRPASTKSISSIGSLPTEWNYQDVTGQGMSQAMALIPSIKRMKASGKAFSK